MLISAFCAENAFGIGKVIRIGNRLKIQPTIGFSFGSTSNLFFSDGDEPESGGEGRVESDFVYTITPGVSIRFDTPSERLKLTMNYEAGIERFVNFTNENTVNDTLTLGIGYLHPSRKLTLNIDDTFTTTKDIVSEQQEGDSRFVREDRINNEIGGDLGLFLGEYVALTFSYANRISVFDNRELESENFVTDSYGTSVSYRLFRSISPTVNYTYATTDFPDDTRNLNGESVTHTIRTGISIEATAKISGRATFGYTLRESENVSGRTNTSTLAIDVELGWKITPRTVFDVALTSGFGETSIGDQTNTERRGIALGLSQKLGRKMTAEIYANHSISDSINIDRRSITDKRSSLGFDFRFDLLRWVSLGAGYRHTLKLSNDNAREFRNNELEFDFQIAADF